MDLLTFLVWLLWISPVYFIIWVIYSRLITCERLIKKSLKNRSTAKLFIHDLLNTAKQYSNSIDKGAGAMSDLVKFVETIAENAIN